MDQRRYPRFSVRFHSSFSSVNLVEGEGTVLDLSLRGCGIAGSVEVLPGTTLALRIHRQDDEVLLTIGQAVVRWCRNGRVGLEFLSLQPEEWAHLQAVVKDLHRQPYERNDDSQDRSVA
ncbi:MAG: hypothetical protein OJF52_001727 [Nitrospira sp.]|jgi:c-di-GMP-binding flagellar brake protein YcgR|nr:MAG: hypothetical protein OJF52_001727 [Nitrospira sp.]